MHLDPILIAHCNLSYLPFHTVRVFQSNLLYHIHMFILLCGFLLAVTVSTSPAALSNPQSGAASLVLPTPQSNQSSLSAGDPRWGPQDFSVSSSFRSTELIGAFVLSTAVEAVSQLANGDFEGTLPEPRIHFSLVECPGMEIMISGMSDSLLKTKYALWGMARASNTLVTHGFKGSTFTLRWQGRIVGSIWFIARTFTIDGNTTAMNETGPTTDLGTTLDTRVVVRGLRWDFKKITSEIIPEEMTLIDAAMGAIGAMNTIAPQTGSLTEPFIGNLLPNYKAINTFVPEEGQHVNKTMVIATVRAEYRFMVSNNYFKALNTQVNMTNTIIGEAVVIINFMGDNSSVAVS